jgi:hypothetical protein
VRHLRFTILSLILALAAPAVLDPAPAAAEPTLFGLRGGLTDDPDTVFLGGHVAFYPTDLRRLRIEPSFELGFGEDAIDFTLRGNLNFKIMFPVSRDAAFYPILGAYVYYLSFDDCEGCDDSEFGLNLGAGFSFSGIGIDFTVGLPDYPDFTFTLSYTFW